ncbi:hypothetical protein [Parapedobacter tibetensis]|uniref:hypothetical protein n=1 Tax=Parapedobacter tibetensis TaxID=2972951 RepID=UPI00214D29A9|nr:hypothetical protein [Parapedobacter tibetensis]
MELTKRQRQSQQLIAYLIKVCWKNPTFKKRFIASPVETIEKVTGKPSHLPEGMRVVVEDQSDSSIIYLNIPAKPPGISMLK